MILCVTLNPCLDKTLVVPPWQPGQNVRGTHLMEVAGGKGNNVARTLARLGRKARPLLPLGGHVGRRVEELLRQDDGLEPLVIPTQAPTREILTVRTGQTAEQSAFFDPNPRILPAESQALRELLRQTLAAGGVEYVALSGSSPCAELDDFWPEAVAAAASRGVPTLLDTYGATLQAGLEARPTAVKINRVEAEQWLGRPVHDEASLREALDRLVEKVSRWAVITLGAAGAAAALGSRRWRLTNPRVEVCNPIGSGDAMAAALIEAELAGRAPEDTLRRAVAAGAANARVWKAGDITVADIDELAGQVQIAPL